MNFDTKKIYENTKDILSQWVLKNKDKKSLLSSFKF